MWRKEDKPMRYKNYIFIAVVVLSFAASAFSQTRTVTVLTEPKAMVWLDDVLRGTSDASGKLTIAPITAGIHKIRVRADGFKEVSQTVTAAQQGDIKIALVKTIDQAELAYQEADRLTSTDREKAIAAYRKAISLRPKYAEANLGLARILSAKNDLDGALKAVAAARRARPGYAEASAVEGRIYVTEGDEDKAIASFKRAITEGKGVQAEANTGLGLLYKEKAESFGSSGDYESENANYTLAVQYFKKAINQLSGAPDAVTLYQFLGLAYEKMKKYKEAIAVYQEFLKLFPNNNESEAVRSFIVQLNKQMSEQ